MFTTKCRSCVLLTYLAVLVADACVAQGWLERKVWHLFIVNARWGAFLCSALTESDYCGSKQTVPIWFAYVSGVVPMFIANCKR